MVMSAGIEQPGDEPPGAEPEKLAPKAEKALLSKSAFASDLVPRRSHDSSGSSEKESPSSLRQRRSLFGLHSLLERSGVSVSRGSSTSPSISRGSRPVLKITGESGKEYEVRQQIGQGSSARVFRAIGPSGVVAIKRMYRDDDEAIVVLKNEFELLRQLEHPGLIRVLDFGVEKGMGPWLALELLQSATSLSQCVKRDGPRSQGTTLSCLRPLSCAVWYLHSKGICHRDVKPENVLLALSEPNEASEESPRCAELKLIDFNVAVPLEPSVTCLSPVALAPFAAPEIWRDEEYSYPVDVWGIGALAYFVMLANFPNAGHFETKPQRGPPAHLFQEELWRTIATDFYQLLRSVLSSDPSARPSAQQVSETLASEAFGTWATVPR
jgi:serine/threonine protein kinase